MQIVNYDKVIYSSFCPVDFYGNCAYTESLIYAIKVGDEKVWVQASRDCGKLYIQVAKAKYTYKHKTYIKEPFKSYESDALRGIIDITEE